MATQRLCFFGSLYQYCVGKRSTNTVECLYSAPAPSRGAQTNNIVVTLTYFTADERSFVVLIVPGTAMADQNLCFCGFLHQYSVGKRFLDTL